MVSISLILVCEFDDGTIMKRDLFAIIWFHHDRIFRVWTRAQGIR